MDSTARKAVVPIFRTYTITHHAKNRAFYRHFHEIYTTEGKIVLPHQNPETSLLRFSPDERTSDISDLYTHIIIIKYKNMVTYIER